jgi:hypothetical protein
MQTAQVAASDMTYGQNGITTGNGYVQDSNSNISYVGKRAVVLLVLDGRIQDGLVLFVRSCRSRGLEAECPVSYISRCSWTVVFTESELRF